MELDGHSIREWNPIDPDGYAWSGSPFNAKAYTGNAITAGTSTFVIQGGGSAAAAAVTNIDYFRFFPNYAFEFTPEDIYVPGSTVQYLLVVAPRGPVTSDNPNPGNVGFYSYTTGNNGNQITIVNRLGPANAGAMVSTPTRRKAKRCAKAWVRGSRRPSRASTTPSARFSALATKALPSSTPRPTRRPLTTDRSTRRAQGRAAWRRTDGSATADPSTTPSARASP